MIELIKIANIQLERTPDHQVVKVAGILRRLKNWLKSKFDSQFEEQVRQLESESAEYSAFIDQLANQVSKVQEAIQDKELEEYRVELLALKDLLNQGTINVSSSIESTVDLERKINEIKLTTHYKKDQVSDSRYTDQVKKWLEEKKGYDVPLDQKVDLKLKETNYYSKLDPKKIIYTPGAFNKLQEMLSKQADRMNVKLNSQFLSKENLLPAVQDALVNGTIQFATLQKPNVRFTSPKTGVLNIIVVSDDFNIPGTNITAKIQVMIRDESPEIEGVLNNLVVATHRKVSLRKISSASRIKKYFSLIKEAQSQELPYKVNTLSELDFAKALKEGYEMSFGKPPSLQTLAFGWAQAALESGRPFKLPQNNVGNIKATKEWINSGKPYFKKSTEEFTSKGKKFIHSDAAWRAYNTPAEGAAGYWNLLKSRYPEALKWAAAGDPTSAGVELGKKTYYTAPIDKYSSSLKSLYETFLKNYSQNFSELSNEKITAEEPKPEVKKWKSEYSNGSKSESNTQTSESNQTTQDQESELLDKLLTSSEEPGAYLSFVKTAIYKNNNEIKNILIIVEGSDLVDNLEYANNLSYLMQDYLSAQTTLHKDNDKVYVQASTHTNEDFRQAAVELSELLTSEANKKINKNIYAIIAEDAISNIAIIKNQETQSNHRKFIMRYS